MKKAEKALSITPSSSRTFASLIYYFLIFFRFSKCQEWVARAVPSCHYKEMHEAAEAPNDGSRKLVGQSKQGPN